MPLHIIDTAGLRETPDEVEREGVRRAWAEIERADLVLWLGPEGAGPAGAWEIEPQYDRADHPAKSAPRYRLSAVTGENIDELKQALIEKTGVSMPKPGEGAINRRQRGLVELAAVALRDARDQRDPLLMAENLRQARLAFDSLVGRASTEDVLDALFGRFCIGK